MNERRAVRLAWSLWLLTMVCVVTIVVFLVLNRSAGGDYVFIGLAVSMFLGYSTMGMLIASRQPRNPIGWIFLTIAISVLLAGLCSEYTQLGLVTAPGSLPGTTLTAWLSYWLFIPAVASIPLVFLLFPTGRVHSRRWRAMPLIYVGLVGLATAGYVLTPHNIGIDISPGLRIENPTGLEGLNDLMAVLTAIFSVSSIGTAFASVVALVLRYRAASGEERQQVRWLAYVATAGAILLLGLFAIGDLGLFGSIFFVALFIILAVAVPAACAIAILKYRLYDLDLVVKKTVVFGLLVGFLTVAYVVLVVAIPALVIGSEASGFNLLSVVFTVVVALAFQPVRVFARRFADRLVYGKRASPYEVLSEFSDRLAGAYSVEDVLPRMTRIAASGTGATSARVWLRIGAQLQPAAAWPGDDEEPAPVRLTGEDLPALPSTSHAFPVLHQGELLGALSLSVPASDPITPSQEKLLRDLAAQAGLVLRNVRLIEELQESRRRIVAAQDERARKIERDIHDGAQQQLVALAVKLRLAEQLAERDPANVRQTLEVLRAEANDALENLRDLARGIYPPLLADRGLAEAIAAQARKASIPVEVDPDGIGRYPQEAEAAVYFCCLEALQNVAKYAKATRAAIRISADDGQLSFSVEDDGAGFDPDTAGRGSGLQNMADRLAALGGVMDVQSTLGKGTRIAGRVPARAVERSG